MFRWLALCLVLCAGAFALVAMATGAFNPRPPVGATVDPADADKDVSQNHDEVVRVASAGGLGRGGAVVIQQARLTPVEREEVPSQRDGAILVIGTDELGDAPQAGDLVPVRFPFLVLEIGDQTAKDYTPPSLPENQWLYLIAAPGSKFKEAVGQTRLGDQWKAYKDSKALKVYRRWVEGDPLEPHKVEVAFEQKYFRRLNEGDWVKKDQLVALVDPTVQVNDASSKVAKLETAEAEYLEAVKTKEEAIRRASSAEYLYSQGKGYISKDDYEAALLNRDRYVEEEKSKDAARKVAAEELSASLSVLKQHEIRSTIPGVIKMVYKHPGESVKNLDQVMQVQNPLKMRVEGLVGVQEAESLAPGMTALVEPNRPARPAAVLQGHQAEVTCVAVSRAGPSGTKLIVSGGEDGTVRFWDAEVANPGAAVTQPQIAQLDQHAGVLAVACTGPKAVRNLALTGDRDGVGRLIDLDRMLPAQAAADAAVGAGARLTQAAPVKLAEKHKGPITCVAFSPDGKVCATGGEDRSIRVWNTDDGKLLSTINGAHKAAVTSLQFARQEGKPLQLVSAGGDDVLTLWDLTSPEAPTPAGVMPRRSGDVAKLGVSADGKYVLFDHGPELRVLSLDDKQIQGVIGSSSAGANFTTMALFAPDGGTVLTNSASDGRLQLWRTPGRASGDQGRAAEMRQFVWNSGTATCGAFDPDEKQPTFAVTGSRDNFVLVWTMPKPDEVQRKPRETRLTLVERSLDSGSRQVRVWADLPEIKLDEWRRGVDLTPGGTATIVVPPAAAVGAK